jgi:hypothetical protein
VIAIFIGKYPRYGSIDGSSVIYAVIISVILVSIDRCLNAFDQWQQNEFELAGKSLYEVAETLRNEWWHPLVGTPEMVIQQIRAYAGAEVEEIILTWGNDMDDI